MSTNLKKRTYFVSSEQKITSESFYIEDNLQVASANLAGWANIYNQISCITAADQQDFCQN